MTTKGQREEKKYEQRKLRKKGKKEGNTEDERSGNEEIAKRIKEDMHE